MADKLVYQDVSTEDMPKQGKALVKQMQDAKAAATAANEAFAQWLDGFLHQAGELDANHSVRLASLKWDKLSVGIGAAVSAKEGKAKISFKR